MENYAKDIDKLRNEFYDKLVEMYGDHYKWISVEIKLLEEPTKGITLTMNTDIRNTIDTWKEIKESEKHDVFRKDVEGPKVENSGAMWDNSSVKKIYS